MKKSTFVSFSKMIQNKATPQPQDSKQAEPQVDYEDLYHASTEQNNQLQQQLLELQNQHAQEKNSWLQEQKNTDIVLRTCQEQVQAWKNEMREHMHGVWTSLLQQLIKDPNFHRLAIHDMISQAVLELGDQKNIHLDVATEHLDLAKKILSGREGWTVSSKEDLTLGIRFSQEQVQWKRELEPVVRDFFDALEEWVKEKE